MAMAYSLLFVEVAGQIINTWPNRKLLNYSYLEQLKDIMPSVLLAVFMGICVFFIDKIGMPDILTLSLQIVFGGIIYIVQSTLFILKRAAKRIPGKLDTE